MIPKKLPQFLWFFLRPYLKTFIGMLLSVSVLAILTSLQPYFLKLIIDKLVSEEVSSTPLWISLFIPAVLFVALFQISDFGWASYDYFKLKTLPKVREDIINKMFSYLQNHSYSYFQKNFTGMLSNKVSDMARGSESVISQLVEPLFSQLLTLGIAIFSIYLVHPLSALMLLVWSIAFMGIVYAFYPKTLAHSVSFSESHSLCMGKLVDSVTNIISAKLFAQNAFERQYLANYVRESRVKDQALQWHTFKIKMIQGLSVTVLFAGMLAVLIYARQQGLVTIGDFAFILSLSMTIMQGLWYLASHFLNFSQEVGICEQALSIVATPHDLIDHENSKTLSVNKGEIVFDDVSFTYERGKNIFRNKSISIPGGQRVGLVGFSGSGKTTFASLILRFYNISSGQILIDGQNIAEVAQDSLRSQIALIPQDPVLFHRTIMENIRYGRLDATDEEVIEASKRAHCHEFIEHMSEGYHTMVGERGLRLSGGQRQRIAIARAILKNAPILILDEATSALDSVTEEKIQDSMDYLMQNRTTIVIAHRLSTLSNMDRILVFMGGQVVEDGSHNDLISIEGHYAKLWQMQAGGFLPEDYEEEDETLIDQEEMVS